jgi:sucrose synthase
MFGKNAKLRELVNLVLVAGDIDASKSKDREEVKEIEKMHSLIEQYKLHVGFRWIRSQTNRVRNGELYRYIADSHGAFVQPALYEGFGLTVVEAMTCGLPTFATSHGGPAEIPIMQMKLVPSLSTSLRDVNLSQICGPKSQKGV